MYWGDTAVNSDHPCLCDVSCTQYTCFGCGTESLCYCQLHWVCTSKKGLCLSCLDRHIREFTPVQQGIQWRSYLDALSDAHRSQAIRNVQGAQTTTHEVISTGPGGAQFLLTTVVDEREGITIKVSRPRGEQNTPNHLQQGEATFIEWGPTYGERDRKIPGLDPCPGCWLPSGHVCSCPF